MRSPRSRLPANPWSRLPANSHFHFNFLAQERVREPHTGQPFGPGGVKGGPSVDLAGTRTVKEILRVVNAKRLSVEIARRFSATVDSSSSTNTDATASVGTDGSTAPAAAAASAAAAAAAAAATAAAATPADVAGAVGRGKGENIGIEGNSMGLRGAAPGIPLGGSGRHYSTQPELRQRHLPEKLERAGGSAGKMAAATELLARVRGQLERSEQRTKGAPGAVRDIAPQR